MPLFKLPIKPGIFDEITDKDAVNRWTNGINARFYKGYPEKMGGGALATTAQFVGKCRGMMQWATISSNQYVALGTSAHLYIYEGGTFYNITPARDTGTLGTDPFVATNGSMDVTVIDTSHGLSAGDYAYYSNAASFNNIAIDGEYTVQSVTNGSAYVINAGTTANATANGGGNGVTYLYEIDTGNEDAVSLFGWGASTWSTPRVTANLGADPFTTINGNTTVQVAYTAHGLIGSQDVSFEGASPFNNVTINGDYTVINVTNANSFNITANTNANANGTGGGNAVIFGKDGWSTAASGNGIASQPRTWSLDKWGEDLMANPRDGAIYIWDATNGVGTRATLIANAPAAVKCIIVSPEDRYLIAYGCTDLSTDEQDPLLLRWCSQEDYTEWDPSTILTANGDLNTSGDKRLDSGSEIKTAIRAGIGQIIILTDEGATLQFATGDPNTVFGFKPLAEKCGAISPNAAAEAAGIVYWMSQTGFYRYDGSVTRMRCDVQRTVFNNINYFQATKVYAGVISEFSEIWWLYPTGTENNCLVAYNWEGDFWWTGQLVRTAVIDVGAASDKPFATNADGFLLNQEVGTDDGDAILPTTLEMYDIMVGEGEDFMHCKRMIPDFKYCTGSVAFNMLTKRYPNSSVTTKGPFVAGATTEKISFRSRGRLSGITMTSNGIGVNWRMGDILLEGVTSGSR